MSKDQIKIEINKVLDQFPSTMLEELLRFLKKIENKNFLDLDQQDIKKILTEDEDLLARLAK